MYEFALWGISLIVLYWAVLSLKNVMDIPI